MASVRTESSGPTGVGIVVTGMGAVTALGGNLPETWRSLVEGCCGIRPLTSFPVDAYRTRIAAEIAPLPSAATRRRHRHLSKADRVALAAAAEAFADAGLEPGRDLPFERIGIVLGGGVSGLPDSELYLQELLVGGNRPRPSLALNHPPDNSTDVLAREWNLLGPRSTVTTACSSSGIAVGYAADLIRFGYADAMIVGGSDVTARLTYAGFNSLRSVDTDPCRPFDIRRKGLSLGEGGGILVLEREDLARRRGAFIRARFLGYGVSSDAWHMTQPDPSGDAGARTYRAALVASRVDRSAVDHVNAHATATPQNDPAEALAIREAFGPRPLVNSVKGAIGHTLCAAGGIEAVITVRTLETGVIPPTVGLEEQDPACPVETVKGEAREARPKIAVSSSFAFGGNSVALVFGRFE
jgi:3-oxoacyl-[acyl-carrier-protein] synthase II